MCVTLMFPVTMIMTCVRILSGVVVPGFIMTRSAAMSMLMISMTIAGRAAICFVVR